MKSSCPLICFLSLHLLSLHAMGRTAPEYLFRPESVLLPFLCQTVDQQSTADQPLASPSLEIAARKVSFSDPQVLIDKEEPQARFVSALWKGNASELPHQRNVLMVGTDYAVIVDYLYREARENKSGGEITLKRCFDPAMLPIDIDQTGAGCQLPPAESGKSFRIESLTAATVGGMTSSQRKGVVFLTQNPLPVAVTTVMLAWKSGKAPKVEYVKAVNPMVVKLRVIFPDGRTDDVAMAWEARPLHIGKSEFDGWAAVLRHDPQGHGNPASESSIEIR